MISTYLKYLSITATILATLANFSIQAQERSESDESAERELEEVVVTARFREESVQDIGAGISA